MSLSGRRILVTGATGGLGENIAKALHDAGATITLSGTRKEKLEALQAELGDRSHIAPCNLGDAAEVEALTGQAESLMGGVDILVNNAGITRDGLAMRMKLEDWETVMDVNLRAAFILSKACLRGMMKQRWGRIISISSVVGVAGNPGQANYAASKAGLIGFSRSLAREVSNRGLTVNCIAPGFIESPMTDALNEKQTEALLASIPAGRMGKPEEVSHAVLYLASDLAAYVTGQVLHVNGGMYIG